MTNSIRIISTLGFFLIAAGCSVKDSNQTEKQHTGHQTVQPAMNDSNMVTLSSRDEQYANITIDTVKVKKMAEFTTLLGTTSIDERRITVVTSRIRGRVDKLFVRSPQEPVNKGQPMYALYSEELLSYENELLIALQQREQFSNMKQAMDQLVVAARKKLLLWGLTNEQLATLEKSGVASPLMTFYSPVSGTLVELAVSEGQYVDLGTVLFRVADLSQLWVEAQIYSSELRWLYERPVVTVEFDAYPNEAFSASPVFDNPTLEPDQKVSLVRFVVAGRSRELKPGMMAYVTIKRNEKTTVVIPKSAILVGNMVTAWVKTGDGMYENRMLELGIQNKKEVEVIYGLTEGDLIVTSGAYLLNSASVLKKGAGMEGMKM